MPIPSEEVPVAFNPCRVGNHYNPRKNYLFYIGVGNGPEIVRYRLRFCRAHALLVQEQLSEFEVNPDDGTLSGGDTATSHCFSCGEPVGHGNAQVFVTGYPPDEERKDYWLRIHSDCTLPDPLSDQWEVKSA